MNALLIVDIQNDFLPDGSLAVPDGDAIIPLVNSLIPQYDLVIATQDWHPANHGSFAANHPGKSPGEMIDLNGVPQVLWPIHCVQNTHGAAFASSLDTVHIKHIFRKGTDPKMDSYSGFFDNDHQHSTGLGDFLRNSGVTEVTVVGLATDYCVKATALDSVKLGFKTILIREACPGVNLQPGDVDRACEEMRSAGVTVI